MNANRMMSVEEAARRWELSIRRVQNHCVTGRIPGAEKWGRAWMLPVDAARPADGRRKDAPKSIASPPFLRESPLLTMTDALNRPGHADEIASSLGNRPGAMILSAYLRYLRGDTDAACEGATRSLVEEMGFYAQISAGMLLSLCAMHSGNALLWNDAREHIRNAPCRNAADEELRAFWLESVDSAIYGEGGYPEWFLRGNLAVLPADSQPAARFFYIKRLYLQSVNDLRENGWANAESANRVSFLPNIAEPLIAQTRLEGAYVAEIYLCLICAICYHVIGDDARAAEHIDRAIALALPDRLYTPLAEYEVNLDFLLEDRLRAADEGAYRAVKRINRRMNEGWIALHNRVFAHSISGSLTTRERETSRLAVMGLSNQEIADRQHVSISTVKQSLRAAMRKTGAQSRAELSNYI